MKNTMIHARWVIAIDMFISIFTQSVILGEPPKFPYALIVLPDSTREGSGAVGMNNHFIGGLSNQSDFTFHATVWGRHGMHDLGTLGGLWSSASDINNHNEVVGWANIPGGDIFTGRHAFLWMNDTMVDLGTLGGDSSIAHAINDNSVVVGESEDAEEIQWGFLWQDGNMFNLGGWLNPDGMLQANDINNEDIVVGVSWSYELGRRIATVRDVNGTFTPLIDIDNGIGFDSGAYAINDHRCIAGQSKSRAVIWKDGQVQVIENSRHFGSLAFGINNFGEVVGWGSDGNPLSDIEGWIWDALNGNVLLNDVLPPNTGFWIDNAEDINDNHQIAGNGFYRNPKSRIYGYLMTPVDPELVLGEPVPGVAGVVNTFTVTGARPGAEVSFVYGMKGGGRFVPHCDVLKAVLQIDDAVVMGKGVADGGGVATIEMFVPDRARDEDILMIQCFDEGNCEESQLLVVNFE